MGDVFAIMGDVFDLRFDLRGRPQTNFVDTLKLKTALMSAPTTPARGQLLTWLNVRLAMLMLAMSPRLQTAQKAT